MSYSPTRRHKRHGTCKHLSVTWKIARFSAHSAQGQHRAIRVMATLSHLARLGCGFLPSGIEVGSVLEGFRNRRLRPLLITRRCVDAVSMKTLCALLLVGLLPEAPLWADD